MATNYSDVIRVETTEAALPTTLRNQMLGMESDNMRRMMYKDSNGNDVYFTPDGMTGINAVDVEFTNISYPGLSNVHDALNYAFEASSAGLTGTGTAGYIPKLTTATSIANSLMQDNGSAITIGGQAIVTGLTASQIVETDASKQLTSAAKNTGYNKALGTTSGTVAEGNHLHTGVYEPAYAVGTTLQYYRGDKSWQTLNTAAVPEQTNLYYTDARARAALSASSPLSYDNSTGAFTHLDTAGNKHVPVGTGGYVARWSVPEAGLLSIGVIRDNGFRVGIGADADDAALFTITSSGSLGAPQLKLNDPGGVNYSSLTTTSSGGLLVNMTNPAFGLVSTSATGSPEIGFYQQSLTSANYKGNVRWEDDGDTLEVTNYFGDILLRPGSAGTAVNMFSLSPTVMTLSCEDPKILLNDTGTDQYDCALQLTGGVLKILGNSTSGAPATPYLQISMSNGYATFDGTVRVVGATSAGNKIVQANSDGELTFVNAAGTGNRTVMVDSDGVIYFA
jgi:hypothetical protein